jgi:hypothetical protein
MTATRFLSLRRYRRKLLGAYSSESATRAATSSPSFMTVRQLRNVEVTRSFESNQALVSFVRATPEGRRR